MSQQIIFTGNTAGDGSGDPLRVAFTKINNNFYELYSEDLVVNIFTANSLVINNNATIGGNLTANVITANIVEFTTLTANIATIIGNITANIFEGNIGIFETLSVVNDAEIGGDLIVFGNIAGNVIGNVTGNVTGNSSTASNLFGTPALPNGTTATTPIYTDNSTLLATTKFVQEIASNIVSNLNLTGDVTTSGNIATLATVNSNVGEFGDITNVAQFTVNNKGLITSASNISIPNTVQISGDATSIGGTTSSNAIVTLNTVNANVGTFGDSADVAQITVNGKGLITSVSNIAIPHVINISGDATGSGTTSSNAVITLNTVNSNIGQFGNTYAVPVITVNNKGLITSVTTNAITGNIQLIGDVTGLGTTGSNISTSLANAQPNINSLGTLTGLNVAGNALITGNLEVFGNTTTINTQTLTVEDSNIIIGNVSTPSNITAMGGGITLLGNTNKTITWNDPTDGWQSSENITAPNFFGNITGNITGNLQGFASNVITNANLTGDITSIGNATTLATVNSNVGQFGDTTHVSQIIVNSKGLITSASNIAINTMVYPGAGVAVSNGSAWLSSYSTNGTGNVVLDTGSSITVSNLSLSNTLETLSTPTITGATLTLNLAAANNFKTTLNANVTTVTISNIAPAGTAQGFTLIFVANGTPNTVAWPGTFKWPAGNAPILTNTSGKTDVFVFMTTDGGSSWLSFISGQNL